MNDLEFNGRRPEYPTAPPEYSEPQPESRIPQEFNMPAEEYCTASEERKGISRGKGATASGKKNRRMERTAIGLFALTISAVMTVTAASVLSEGTFLPELEAATGQWASAVDGPAISRAGGMDLQAAVLAWNGGGKGASPGPGTPATALAAPNQEVDQEKEPDTAQIPEESQPERGAPAFTSPESTTAEPSVRPEPAQASNTEPSLSAVPHQEVPASPGSIPDQKPEPPAPTAPVLPDVQPLIPPVEPLEPAPVINEEGNGADDGESGTDGSAHSHSWAADTRIPATCTEDGAILYICRGCGEERATVLPAAGHDWSSWSDTGDSVCHSRACRRCGEEKRQRHSMEEWKNTGEGTHVAACTVCGAHLEEVHQESWKIEADATCTESGTRYKFCEACGTRISGPEDIPALGHAWDAGRETAPATCTVPGTMEYTCTRCGGTKNEQTGPLGHTWTQYQDNGDGTHKKICTVCQTVEAEVHAFADGLCACGAEQPQPTARLTLTQLSYQAVNNWGLIGTASVEAENCDNLEAAIELAGDGWGLNTARLQNNNSTFAFIIMPEDQAMTEGSGRFVITLTNGGEELLQQTYTFTLAPPETEGGVPVVTFALMGR